MVAALVALLLRVPSHQAREFTKDRKAAEIPRLTMDGVADFHGLRVTFISGVIEAGATVKEAQELARHSTPLLTMNTYARARGGRLADLATQVDELTQEHVPSMQALAAGAEAQVTSDEQAVSYAKGRVVEDTGLEPVASTMPLSRSPS